MFGKTMRIPDAMLPRYARLAAAWPVAKVEKLEAALASGAASPMDEKKRIAEDLVALYHGHDAARAARDWFERTIQGGEIPADMPELPLAGAREDRRPAGGGEIRRLEAGRAAADRRRGRPGRRQRRHRSRRPLDGSRPGGLQVGSRKFVRVIP